MPIRFLLLNLEHLFLHFVCGSYIYNCRWRTEAASLFSVRACDIPLDRNVKEV